jgi:outer membrane protein assembly factor BamB
VSDRLVFVASQTGEVYALDRRTGALQWTIPPAVDASNTRHPQHEHDYRTLALHKRILGITSFSGQVVGVDIDTRHEVWRFDGSALGSGGYELVPGHGSFYAPFFSGYLAALDAETGVLHWRTHDPALGFHRGPVVVGPDLVVAGESGTWRLRSQPPPQP